MNNLLVKDIFKLAIKPKFFIGSIGYMYVTNSMIGGYIERAEYIKVLK